MTLSFRRLTMLVAGLGLSIGIVLLVAASPSHSRRSLEIELQAPAGTSARLFWSADQHWVEDQSFRVPLQTTTNLQRVRFPIPAEGMPWVRLEPTTAQSEVVLGRMRLLDSREHVIGTLDPDVLKPISEGSTVARMGDGLHVNTSPGATTPALITTIGCLDRIPLLGDRSRVTPAALALVSAICGAILLASIAVVAKATFGRTQANGRAMTTRQLALAGLWMAGLLLVVFSAKLLVMRDTPVMTPFWDQWNAVAAELFIPYKECRLPWSKMFTLHNEHRILFTRVLALDLLAVNGQWDPRFEQVFDAAMHSLTAVILAAVFWVANGRRHLDLLVFVCALVFALPFGWENTLVGFQSQFYFFVLLSILAFWLTCAHRVLTLQWWLGAACAFCALFTCAGGVITGAVVAGLSMLKLAGDRRDWRRDVAGLAIGMAILGVGAVLASPPIAGHEELRAHGILQFFRALATNLAWPWVGDRRAAFVMWLPLGLLLIPLLRRPSRVTVHHRLIVGVGAWVVLNGVAVAYGRGAGAPVPASRYMDFLSLGLVANAAALALVVDRLGTKGTKRVAQVMLGLWLVFSAVGVDRVASTDVDLEHYRKFYAAHTANVRAFVITGNRQDFTSKRPLYDLPFPDAPTLVGLLENPALRRILPATLREPLPVKARTTTNDAFVQEGPFARSVPRDPLARYWWSLSEQGKSAEGRFESQPMSCQVDGRLRLQVAGYLGWEHQYMAFRNLRTGDQTPIRPTRVAREDWVTLTANCPSDPFEIVAIDDADNSWFGFREPVEIGFGSLMAEWLIANSRQLLFIGFAMAALALRWSGPSLTSTSGSVASDPVAVVL
jgi:hypothetical protein